MKAIIFAALLVCLLAVNPLDKLNAVAREDKCTANVLDTIKPEIDAKLQQLKGVIIYSFRRTTSTSKLKLSLLWKKERKCSTNATRTNPQSRLEILLNGTELPSSSPQTASRMSELSSFSLTPSSKTHLTTLMTLWLASSNSSSEDKLLLTASNLNTSSSDHTSLK